MQNVEKFLVQCQSVKELEAHLWNLKNHQTTNLELPQTEDRLLKIVRNEMLMPFELNTLRLWFSKNFEEGGGFY